MWPISNPWEKLYCLLHGRQACQQENRQEKKPYKMVQSPDIDCQDPQMQQAHLPSWPDINDGSRLLKMVEQYLNRTTFTGSTRLPSEQKSIVPLMQLCKKILNFVLQTYRHL